jgi:hypothetical protein
MFTHPITHISPLSLSRWQGQLPLVLASTAHAKIQQTLGKKKNGFLSLVKGSTNIGKVHIYKKAGYVLIYQPYTLQRFTLPPGNHHQC